ncbi:MAG: hypothetical protein R3C11_16510 [Planctomycetaceae bacterium]
MAIYRLMLPSLLLASTLLTGCAHTFRSTANEEGEFSTARLLSMADTFEAQGDQKRAKELHEAIRLRDPNHSYLTQNFAPTTPAVEKLNYTPPEIGSNPMSKFTSTPGKADSDFTQTDEQPLTGVIARTSETHEEAPRLLDVYAPFDTAELSSLEAEETEFAQERGAEDYFALTESSLNGKKSTSPQMTFATEPEATQESIPDFKKNSTLD